MALEGAAPGSLIVVRPPSPMATVVQPKDVAGYLEREHATASIRRHATFIAGLGGVAFAVVEHGRVASLCRVGKPDDAWAIAMRDLLKAHP
jgi:hypothetical protein